MSEPKSYWLKVEGGTWQEVTREAFISAEQASGFRSSFGQNSLATGGFTTGSLNGRLVYSEKIEVYDAFDPEFAAILWKKEKVEVSVADLKSLIERIHIALHGVTGHTNCDFCSEVENLTK